MRRASIGLTALGFFLAGCASTSGAGPAAGSSPAAGAPGAGPSVAAPGAAAGSERKATSGLAAFQPASGPAAPAVNPFEGTAFYPNPDYAKSTQAVAAQFPKEATALKKLATIPTAVWLDTIAKIESLPRHLDEAAALGKKTGRPVVPVFVVYDLPGRDCAAEASNGEIPLAEAARYQREYIDAIAAHFKARPDQRVVAIIEPDSLANLATNLGLEKCAAADPVYRAGVAYAVAKLSLPNVFLYLDAAHGGWLGWKRSLDAIAAVYKDVLTRAGGPDRIRGFAVNVSNYNPLRRPGARRGSPADPAPDEMGYVEDLAKALAAVGITNKGYIIDTSRNGKVALDRAPGNWCNIKGAGLGERPKVAPAPLLDAYFWIKVPGESDGVADPQAPRFDPTCASEDAVPGAPQAGQLFPAYLVELIKNAQPPLK
jgi:cellulose 1,4-beta-cellobiosidase